MCLQIPNATNSTISRGQWRWGLEDLTRTENDSLSTKHFSDTEEGRRREARLTSRPCRIWDLSEGETAAREETKGLPRGAAGTER